MQRLFRSLRKRGKNKSPRRFFFNFQPRTASAAISCLSFLLSFSPLRLSALREIPPHSGGGSDRERAHALLGQAHRRVNDGLLRGGPWDQATGALGVEKRRRLFRQQL